MKTTFLKLMVHVSWLAFLVAASCQKENVSGSTPVSTQAQTEMTAHDNSQMIAIAQDAMDVTGSAMASNGISNGRYSESQRTSGHGMDMDCAPSIISSTFSIDRTHKDSVIYSGSLTIDFGTGSNCKDSTEVRKGKLIDAFKLIVRLKDTLSYNLTESVTFQSYQKDSVQVDGMFSKVSTSDAVSTLTIQNAKLTYADGTAVTWNGTLINEYILEGFHELPQESRKVTGSINGMDRQGVSFSSSISNAILFEYSCSRDIPVAGTIDLMVGSVASTIDFGSGTCDKDYTITTGGTVTTYTFKRHHHV